jgi:2-C-methyl-D-erythritol 2,4-cyclodiphosphate synthase
MFRIGHGYDVHALVEGRKLILGGVEIEYSKGLLGHSDADVLIHALCDALLGAAALGDIGRHFPDTDPVYEGADSRELLRRVVSLLPDFKIVNADITAIAQAPKLLPYIERMRSNLADVLGIGIDRINIKATTTERLGFIGREEAIAAEAVVLLERQDELSVEELGI